jgi:hypothetical protein
MNIGKAEEIKKVYQSVCRFNLNIEGRFWRDVAADGQEREKLRRLS